MMKNKRRGISTVVGLIFMVIIALSLFSSIYVVMNSYQDLFETSDTRYRFLVDKRSEDLTIVDAELDLDNTLLLEIKNTGSITLRIITIWVNDSYTDLVNKNVVLTPGDTVTVDTNYTIQVGENYIIKIVTERGNIFTTFIPVTGATANWKNEENTPEVIPPGSVVIIDAIPFYTTYYPNSYNIIYGSLDSGSITYLKSDDSVYLIFNSQPAENVSRLYSHIETINLGPKQCYILKTSSWDSTGTNLSVIIDDEGWYKLGTFVYPLNNLILPAGTWRFYYRGYYTFESEEGVWRYRRAITIGSIGQPLSEYQIKIILTPDNFDYDKANPDGSDIRFTDNDGNSLSYWIETWNPSGTSIIWVKVPYIPPHDNVTIYMYYGNPDAESQSNLLEVMEKLPTDEEPGFKIYYEEWIMPVLGLIGGGEAKGWCKDDWQWIYNLPFDFPFYSKKYKHVAIASNGYIEVNGERGSSDNENSVEKLIEHKYISPFWENLMTNYPADADIYITRNYSDEYGEGIVIRWVASFYNQRGSVNFEVVLYKNGLIRFNYGYIDGEDDDRPTVGISRGDGEHYTISSYNDQPADWYSNRNSLLFWPRKKASTEPSVTIGSEESIPSCKYAVDIVVYKSNGAIKQTIAEKVAQVNVPPDNISTVYADYTLSEDYIPEGDEYLGIIYYVYVSEIDDGEITVYLEVDNKNVPVEQQTRLEIVDSTPFPTQYKVQVEFYGSSELTFEWTNITLTVDSSYTENNVNVTLQLYNYLTNQYQVSGDGYISFTYNVYPNDTTITQIITENLSRFRDENTGEWKLMFTAYMDTDFNDGFFKAKLDLIEYKVGGEIPSPSPLIDYIYIGIANTNHFYRYDPVNNRCDNITFIMPSGLVWVEGSAAVYLPSLKSIFFENTTHIFVFNVSTFSTPQLIGQLPVTASSGASLSYLTNTSILYIPGDERTDAWILNINTDNLTESSWQAIASIPENVTRYSCAVGDGNGSVYLVIGETSDGFYRYDLSQNRWIQLAAAPATLVTGLAYCSSNNRIYMTDSGGGIYEYVIEENKWYPLSPKIPVSTQYPGNRLLCDNRNLYYIRMDYTGEIIYIPLIQLTRNT